MERIKNLFNKIPNLVHCLIFYSAILYLIIPLKDKYSFFIWVICCLYMGRLCTCYSQKKSNEKWHEEMGYHKGYMEGCKKFIDVFIEFIQEQKNQSIISENKTDESNK